ncbi:hypothetical protein [Kutzneria kofuensis]|uniref:Uncharacterized protein n=1 Tax=Kutzneria kofuensis TaxID=103725 RepID=A0A7W9KD08_9PSEU|nr:hypothetical protein [Kutzneria kofuensis]MBB5889923.1 hypothetical protein [Kutzneria kofuensis]
MSSLLPPPLDAGAQGPPTAAALRKLAFLQHRTRKLHITRVTAHPTTQWVSQQARNPGSRVESLRFVLRDRDSKYADSFDAVFEAEEMKVLSNAPRLRA